LSCAQHIEHYEIALFLHETAESDRETIARYVVQAGK
jgi:hypothetical protein